MAHRWGMAVDLDRCTGCGACVTACHAENNIPTVGAEQAARGRAMHWIRVERYWEGEFPGRAAQVPAGDVPAVRQRAVRAGVPDLRQPSHRGRPERAGLQPLHRHALLRQRLPVQRPLLRLLQPVSGTKPLHLQLNPDVSVREVGVMEKCTFCVQRIKAAKIDGEGREARAEGRRDPAGLRAGVPGHGARVRRSQRSGERGVAAVALAARQQAARGSRHAAEGHLSRAAEPGMSRRLRPAARPTTCCGRCCRPRGGSTLLVAVPRRASSPAALRHLGVPDVHTASASPASAGRSSGASTSPTSSSGSASATPAR